MLSKEIRKTKARQLQPRREAKGDYWNGVCTGWIIKPSVPKHRTKHKSITLTTSFICHLTPDRSCIVPTVPALQSNYYLWCWPVKLSVRNHTVTWQKDLLQHFGASGLCEQHVSTLSWVSVAALASRWRPRKISTPSMKLLNIFSSSRTRSSSKYMTRMTAMWCIHAAAGRSVHTFSLLYKWPHQLVTSKSHCLHHTNQQ